MAEKIDESIGTAPPSRHTSVSLEAQNLSAYPEAEGEVANYLQGWPLHAVTLALVFTVPLNGRQSANQCACKALSGSLSCEPRSIDREHFSGSHHEQSAGI